MTIPNKMLNGKYVGNFTIGDKVKVELNEKFHDGEVVMCTGYKYGMPGGYQYGVTLDQGGYHQVYEYQLSCLGRLI